MVLIALKTDGGGVGGAKSYLRGRADYDKWIIGADEGAVFYKKVAGREGLFDYAVISPTGIVTEVNKAGRYYNKPTGKVFTLAQNNVADKFTSGIDLLLPIENKYNEKLSGAIEKAELGFYYEAFKDCALLSKKAGLKEEALKLADDIRTALEKKVQTLVEIVENKEAKDRFPAYIKLSKLATALRKEKFIKPAQSVLRKVSREKQMKKEIDAQRYYMSMMKKAEKLNIEQKQKLLLPGLKSFFEKYKGTHYGEKAKQEIRNLGGRI